MTKGKAPADQFYWGDWLRDAELQMACSATRGIWANALGHMWFAKTKGELIGSKERLAPFLNATSEDFAVFLEEAKALGFCDIFTDGNGNITVRNRRMIRQIIEQAGNRERQKRFREKGGGKPDNWAAIRIKILKRDDYMCGYCGKKAITVDHLIPKSKSGTEDDNNLVSCCKSCNQIKGNRTVKEAGFGFYKYYKYNEQQLYNAKITPPSPSSPSSSSKKKILVQFNNFWKSYPKKRAKKDAEKAFLKLNPSSQLLDMILSKLEIAKGSDDWEKEDGRFIPLAATWLRGERWEDELEEEGSESEAYKAYLREQEKKRD